MRTGIATVVKNAGSHYLLAELPQWQLFPAVLRGHLRLSESEATNPIAVGDHVSFESDSPAEIQTGEPMSTFEHPAVITGLLDRKNYVIRKSTNLSHQSHVIAANLDNAFVIVSLYFPEIKLPFLDRILVTCGVYNVPATIVLNKLDLYGTEAADQVAYFHKIYEGASYRVIDASAKTGEGIDELRKACASSNQEGAEVTAPINLFSGESGVGKSSLIKAIDPSLDPKVGKISTAHLQGMHTTSLYEMYHLSGGGYIIDTPGLRGFGLVDLEKEEIATYFPEMLQVTDDCRFTPCTHTHEPGCAVKAAVDSGQISPERYASYLGMLEESRKYR